MGILDFLKKKEKVVEKPKPVEVVVEKAQVEPIQVQEEKPVTKPKPKKYYPKKPKTK
jgi:hypothetical protein